MGFPLVSLSYEPSFKCLRLTKKDFESTTGPTTPYSEGGLGPEGGGRGEGWEREREGGREGVKRGKK